MLTEKQRAEVEIRSSHGTYGMFAEAIMALDDQDGLTNSVLLDGHRQQATLEKRVSGAIEYGNRMRDNANWALEDLKKRVKALEGKQPELEPELEPERFAAYDPPFFREMSLLFEKVALEIHGVAESCSAGGYEYCTVALGRLHRWSKQMFDQLGVHPAQTEPKPEPRIVYLWEVRNSCGRFVADGQRLTYEAACHAAGKVLISDGNYTLVIKLRQHEKPESSSTTVPTP